MGWILVAFDLPVLTKQERREATRFRKNLLDDGFFMKQYSLYVRPCTSWEKLEKHAKRLEAYSPHGGNVHIWFMTDKQWEKSITIIGKDYHQGNRSLGEQIPLPLEFW